MLKEIFLFELKYRKVRAANYIYFGVIFVLSFMVVASPLVSVGGAVGQIKPNAPFVIRAIDIRDVINFYDGPPRR